MNPRLPRRRFLQAGAAAAAFPAIIPRSVRGANERLNVAAIGAGGKGEVDINGCSSENIYALCDVDESRAGKMFKRFKGTRVYKDFRDLLDKESERIDAVTVSAPDHIHAPAAVMAMKLGKHVYCQKPLSHSVYEARVMARVAKEKKVATQMGNQGHSHPDQRRNVELIQAGVLGKVREVHVWTNRPIWPQGIGRPKDGEKVPAGLDWDLWLGPAPERPYSKAYVPFKWRGWWDFGTGALGDMGCHNCDIAFWSLRLGAPSTVEAESSGLNDETAPKSSTIRYVFPARGDLPEVQFTWYDGGRKPSPALVKQKELPGNGAILVGDKDSLFVTNIWGKGVFVSGAKYEDFKDVPQTLPRRPEPFDKNHYQEWIAACKGGPPALSNMVDYAGPLSEAILLGNVALRVGKKIEWDSEKLEAKNAPEAAKYVRREYRAGWEL